LKNEVATIGRIRFDLRRGLVVTQVAISLLLLIGAGLFVRSLQNLRSLDPGFARERVLLVNVNPQQSGYKGQRLRDFYERLLARVRNMNGVRVASLAAITPLAGSRWEQRHPGGSYTWKPDEKPYVDFNAVSRGYFESMGIPLLAGRDFTPEDNPAFTPDPSRVQPKEPEKLGPPPPVAIVNEAFAKHFFAHTSRSDGTSPIVISRTPTGSSRSSASSKDSKYFNIREAVEPMVYVPMWRFGANGTTLCVRATGRPEQLVSAVRRETANIDPAIPVLQTLTMEEQFDT